jgi:hypothetical protein
MFVKIVIKIKINIVIKLLKCVKILVEENVVMVLNVIK